MDGVCAFALLSVVADMRYVRPGKAEYKRKPLHAYLMAHEGALPYLFIDLLIRKALLTSLEALNPYSLL